MYISILIIILFSFTFTGCETAHRGAQEVGKVGEDEDNPFGR